MRMGTTFEKVTLVEVAQQAGVSLATVDRVVNGRPGVHSRTTARVEAVIAQLRYRPDPAAARLARNLTVKLCFILPKGTNGFVDLLSEQVRVTADWLAGQKAYVDTILADVFDPEALAQALESAGCQYQGIAAVALAILGCGRRSMNSRPRTLPSLRSCPMPRLRGGCAMSASTTLRQGERQAR
jgi:LacI family transcriptional regulator